MSEDKHDNPLLNELDSLKGLLEAAEADFTDAVDGLRMSARKMGDSDDQAVNIAEEFLPEAYLVEVDRKAPARSDSFRSSAPSPSFPTAGSDATGQPPTLNNAVEKKQNSIEADPKRQPSSGKASVKRGVKQSGMPEIPVLDEAVSAEEVRQKAPDALGATSWQELETIVDLLVERRLKDMRKILKKELLSELERHTGRGPGKR